MENMLSVRFEKREFDLGDDKLVNFLFKGFRCSQDVAYKLAYMIGQMIGLSGVGIEVEDEDGVGTAWLEIDDIRDVLDLEDEVCIGSEVEDTDVVSENISDVQE